MTGLPFYDEHGRVNSPVVWADRQFEPTGEIAAAELARRARSVGFSARLMMAALKHLRVDSVDVGGRTVLRRPVDSAPGPVGLSNDGGRRQADAITLAENAMRQHVESHGPFVSVAEAIRRVGGSAPFMDARAKGKLAIFRQGRQRLVSEPELTALLSGREQPAWTRRSKPAKAPPEWLRPAKSSKERPAWADKRSSRPVPPEWSRRKGGGR
jgi:hypothetical protein